MGKFWSGVVAAMLALASGPGAALAEVVDVSQTVGANGSIGAVATMTVTARNVSDNSAAAGIAFGAVVLGATPWKVAPQYLRIVHSNNNANWAVRILTNNRSAFPTMAGKVLDPKTATTDQDDILGYGGLIGTNPSDPNDRVTLAWQVYKDPVVGGPVAPPDTSVGGAFNSPWAFMADASDCPSTATNCRTATPSTIDKTIEFLRVMQGDASSAFLKLHPDNGVRTADGDVPLYVAARFGGAPADTYTSTIILEMYHF